MTPLDLLGLCIVCATALAWHAVSRRYRNLEQREWERRAEVIGAAERMAARWARDAKEEADRAQAAADTATSAVAQRDHARILVRLDNLEARKR